MEYLSFRLRCPVCNAEFGAELPSGVEAVAFDTDFRPIFEGRDPVAAELHACPSCRYAGYAAAFEREAGDEPEEELDRRNVPAPVSPLGLPEEDDLDDLRRFIRRGALVEEAGLAKDAEPTPAERFLLAARCREYLGDEDHLALADLLLRGAWCARAASETGRERQLLGEALSHLVAALDAGKVPEPEKGRLLYVAGESARRAGDFARAVDLLGQVETSVDADEEEGAKLLRLARRQEALASVKSDVGARMPDELASPDDEDGEGGLSRRRGRTASDEGGDS